MASPWSWSVASMTCALGLLACGRDRRESTHMKAITTAVPADPFIADNALELWRATRSAAVFVGVTESAGDPPGQWSGFERTGQIVVVRVAESICGPAPASPTTLDIEIFKGTRTAADQPALAAWIATPQSRVIYLVEEGHIVDEDLGALPAEPAVVAWLSDACRSDVPPPGIPGVLQVFTDLVAADRELAAVFAHIAPSVLDVDDNTRTIARLTVSQGQLGLYTGVRRDRVVGSRPPDVRMRATATELAGALSGELPLEHLIVGGTAPGLVRALSDAAARIQRAPRSGARLAAAAGARR